MCSHQVRAFNSSLRGHTQNHYHPIKSCCHYLLTIQAISQLCHLVSVLDFHCSLISQFSSYYPMHRSFSLTSQALQMNNLFGKSASALSSAYWIGFLNPFHSTSITYGQKICLAQARFPSRKPFWITGTTHQAQFPLVWEE